MSNAKQSKNNDDQDPMTETNPRKKITTIDPKTGERKTIEEESTKNANDIKIAVDTTENYEKSRMKLAFQKVMDSWNAILEAEFDIWCQNQTKWREVRSPYLPPGDATVLKFIQDFCKKKSTPGVIIECHGFDRYGFSSAFDGNQSMGTTFRFVYKEKKDDF
jgi:hypothetical protein